MEKAGYVEGLEAAGYTAGEAKAAGYSISEAKIAGFVVGLKRAGYNLLDVKAAGYTLEEIRTAGYSCGDAKAAGYTLEELRTVGYTFQEVKEVGFAVEGSGVYRFGNGDVYDGEWKAGTMEGRGVYRFANGDTYDDGEYLHASGDVDSSFYEQGRPVGEGVRWLADGKRAARLRNGVVVDELRYSNYVSRRVVEKISLEEARQTAERLGLLIPSPLPGV